jgi:hypothetical protein
MSLTTKKYGFSSGFQRESISLIKMKAKPFEF